MGEDDIVELLWKRGHIVQNSQAERPPVPPPILRGSGSGGGGGGEGNAPFLPQPPPLQQPSDDHNLFIREDEMASWLHHHPPPLPLGHEEDEFPSHLFYPGGLVSTPFTQPQGFLSLTPPLPLQPPPLATVIYPPTAAGERPTGQVVEEAGGRAENFTNFARLRIEGAAAPWLPVVRDLTQVGSSATPSSTVTETCLTPAVATGSGVAHTFAVPRAICDIPGPSSLVVPRTETEPLQVQPAAEETEGAEDERKRKEREETAAGDTEETGEEGRPSTSRKRSRAAEMHNISERRRREKINEKMKTLQELIPRCNKTDKASMLEDAIEYVKSLQTQIQMMSTGVPMMYNPNMQRFMPPSAMGMMGVNQPPFAPFPGRPFPRPPHVAGLPPPPPPPYPFAFDPSRVPLPSQQSNPVPNQPQFPGYMNPYSQFVGLQQMEQPLRLPLPPPPPPLQNQTTSQLSFGQASGSKEPEDQGNKPAG